MKAWEMVMGSNILIKRGNGLEVLDRGELTIRPAPIQDIDSYLLRGAAFPITDTEDLEAAQYWLSLAQEIPVLAGAQTDEPQLVELPEDEEGAELEELP